MSNGHNTVFPMDGTPNKKMPTNEVETSYINSLGPNASDISLSTEPTILVDNQRTNINKQNDRREGINSSKMEDANTRRLPFWLWYLIAKSLGLKMTPNEKPICAIILYVLTLLSGLGYIIASVWYCLYDVVSNHKGHSAQLQGTVTVLVTALWCALGVYANKLAYRLFGHRKFLTMLRLHSKTVFKLNTAFVVLFLWTAFIVLHNIGTFKFWIGTPCAKISLDRLVCQVRYGCQVIFSVFALLWNVLVAVILVSVCRTHAIAIRKFIIEVEQDAVAVDPLNETTKDLANDYAAIDEDYFDELVDDSEDDLDRRIARSRHKIVDSNNTLSTVDEGCASTSVPPLSNSSSANLATGSFQPPMTNTYILQKYWSIMLKLRISSLAMQSWMVSVIALTTIWAAVNLVKWLSHDPHLYDILNFVIPLLLLPLLCSSYSEVNNEGLLLPRSIKSVEHRLEILQFIHAFPLQLTVYNYAISYFTIGTIVSGFLLTILSRMLMINLSSFSLEAEEDVADTVVVLSE